jgi:predicted ABC-type ATPase
MLSRAMELAARHECFALETTMASRSLAPWIGSLTAAGYQFQLVFLWLPNADIAVARVAERVRLGGHHVPEETVRRRYASGLKNFFRLYQRMSSSWRVLDNSGLGTLSMLASGRGATLDACSEYRRAAGGATCARSRHPGGCARSA